MKTTEYLHEILNEISRTAALIADSEADKLADLILSADQIFTSERRSGFMAKAFAMRMMHIPNAYIVGETLTPPSKKAVSSSSAQAQAKQKSASYG